jgi:hypothetical protein
MRIRRRAIAAALGGAPSAESVAALSGPRSARELLAAARLIGRLYRASPRGAAIRRDVVRRLVLAVKSAWRSTCAS